MTKNYKTVNQSSIARGKVDFKLYNRKISQALPEEKLTVIHKTTKQVKHSPGKADCNS